MYDYVKTENDIMSKNIAKRLISGVLALASMTACVATATACETNTPSVEMVLSFNGNPYVLNYKLYREIAPRTVKHFLWLADKGYYDGLCVHSYEEGAEKMYTGGYTYSEDGDLVYKEYYTEVKKYEDFPVSVWVAKTGDEFLYTLCGEFEDNNFTVENGSLRQTYGSLTMYYTEKDSTESVGVEYLGDYKTGERAYREYQYNSATSLFYISLSNSSTRNNDYCTFAELEESSEENLEEFEEALETYIEENFDDEESEDTFTKQETVTVDTDDPYEDGKNTATYYVPSKPIIIEKVTVKKF